MDGAMRPPPVPQKTKRGQVAPPADEPAPKRIEQLGKGNQIQEKHQIGSLKKHGRDWE